MGTLCVEYPESLLDVLNLSPETFEREARFALAVKLLEMGRLSSGQAAGPAGVSRIEFLLSCRQFGAASVQWDESELEAEFEDLGSRHAKSSATRAHSLPWRFGSDDMAARDVNELKKKMEKLSQSEKLQLMAYLAEQRRLGAQKRSQRRKWSGIRGMAPYPLTQEDAQDWVSQTRAESDAERGT